MTTQGPIVPRDGADVRHDLRAAAERSPLPVAPADGRSWASVLFDGDEWIDPSEPSQALLEAFAQLHAGLAAHLETVPMRVQVAWLRDRLGIATLPGVPDRVVVAATADPARTPLSIPAGTAVRAKDSSKQERRYATPETLTIHGIEVIDVVAHSAEVVEGGAVRDTAARWADRGVPFAPFSDQPPAAHRFFLLSDLLTFDGGSMTVRLKFAGAFDARVLDPVVWEFPMPGGVGTAQRVASTATTIDLVLLDGCTPAGVLGRTSAYLCASLPWHVRTPAVLAFAPGEITVQVVGRQGVIPDAVFANAAKLDPTKELQPFGSAPRRGDAFYVRSDEAFGKQLASLKVVLALLDPSDGSVQPAPWRPIPSGTAQATEILETKVKPSVVVNDKVWWAIQSAFALIVSPANPHIDWQRFGSDGGWQTLGTTGSSLESFAWSGTTPQGTPCSFPTELGGTGHFLRAYLADGDFGWAAYQAGLAKYAAEAAKPGGSPDATLLIAPDAPILTTVRVEYTTRALPPTVMVSVDGWSTRHRTSAFPQPLFALPFAFDGQSAGMLSIGLRLGADALGSSVSLYVDVESAPACGSAAQSPLRWEYWSDDDDDWRSLDVADGTRGLRQPGLLRFIAPFDWPEGSEGTSSAEGRWIRAVTSDPSTVGAILSIEPDAVEALQIVAPGALDSAYAALEPGQVKGLLAAAPGVTKLTNTLPGRPGRPPEGGEEQSYRSRAVGAVRHRWRAVTAWDCEELIRTGLPEVAAVRCLPHTGADGELAPGWVGAVIVPSTPERLPLPSVSLAERIRDQLAPALPVNAQLAVLCPLYVPVTVVSELVLAPGLGALDARASIVAALEQFLHPAAGDHVRFGVELFGSSIAAWLEARPEVDHLESFWLVAGGLPVERVTVDACRGVVASAGDHVLALREQL